MSQFSKFTTLPEHITKGYSSPTKKRTPWRGFTRIPRRILDDQQQHTEWTREVKSRFTQFIPREFFEQVRYLHSANEGIIAAAREVANRLDRANDWLYHDEATQDFLVCPNITNNLKLRQLCEEVFVTFAAQEDFLNHYANYIHFYTNAHDHHDVAVSFDDLDALRMSHYYAKTANQFLEDAEEAYTRYIVCGRIGCLEDVLCLCKHFSFVHLDKHKRTQHRQRQLMLLYRRQLPTELDGKRLFFQHHAQDVFNKNVRAMRNYCKQIVKMRPERENLNILQHSILHARVMIANNPAFFLADAAAALKDLSLHIITTSAQERLHHMHELDKESYTQIKFNHRLPKRPDDALLEDEIEGGAQTEEEHLLIRMTRLEDMKFAYHWDMAKDWKHQLIVRHEWEAWLLQQNDKFHFYSYLFESRMGYDTTCLTVNRKYPHLFENCDLEADSGERKDIGGSDAHEKYQCAVDTMQHALMRNDVNALMRAYINLVRTRLAVYLLPEQQQDHRQMIHEFNKTLDQHIYQHEVESEELVMQPDEPSEFIPDDETGEDESGFTTRFEIMNEIEGGHFIDKIKQHKLDQDTRKMTAQGFATLMFHIHSSTSPKQREKIFMILEARLGALYVDKKGIVHYTGTEFEGGDDEVENIDQTPVVSNPDPNHSKPVARFGRTFESEVDVASIIKRPYLLEPSIPVTTSALIGSTVYATGIPYTILQKKLPLLGLTNYHATINVTTKLTLRLNRTQYCSGILVLWCRPREAFGPGTPGVPDDVELYPHCFINLAYDSTGSIDVPMVTLKNYKKLPYNADFTTGEQQFFISVWNPLVVSDNMPPQIEGALFFEFTDVEIVYKRGNLSAAPSAIVEGAGPSKQREQQWIEMTDMSPNPTDIPLTSATDSSVMSGSDPLKHQTTLDKIGTSMGRMTGRGLAKAGIPFLSDIAKIFGDVTGYYDAPLMPLSEEGDVCVVDHPKPGHDMRVKGGDQQRSTEWSPYNIQQYINTRCRLSVIGWTTSQISGEKIASISTSLNQTNTVAFTFSPSPILHVARHFRFWRGSLKFTIEIVASRFHQGHLLFCWDPLNSVASLDEALQLYNCTLDIGSKNIVSFEVPFVNQTDYAETNDVPRGEISIFILNPLIAPNTVAPQVAINIYWQAGHDLEFNTIRDPLQSIWKPYSPVVVEGGEEEGAMTQEERTLNWTPLKGKDGRGRANYNHGDVRNLRRRARFVVSATMAATTDISSWTNIASLPHNQAIMNITPGDWGATNIPFNPMFRKGGGRWVIVSNVSKADSVVIRANNFFPTSYTPVAIGSSVADVDDLANGTVYLTFNSEGIARVETTQYGVLPITFGPYGYRTPEAAYTPNTYLEIAIRGKIFQDLFFDFLYEAGDDEEFYFPLQNFPLSVPTVQTSIRPREPQKDVVLGTKKKAVYTWPKELKPQFDTVVEGGDCEVEGVMDFFNSAFDVLKNLKEKFYEFCGLMKNLGAAAVGVGACYSNFASFYETGQIIGESLFDNILSILTSVFGLYSGTSLGKVISLANLGKIIYDIVRKLEHQSSGRDDSILNLHNDTPSSHVSDFKSCTSSPLQPRKMYEDPVYKVNQGASTSRASAWDGGNPFSKYYTEDEFDVRLRKCQDKTEAGEDLLPDLMSSSEGLATSLARVVIKALGYNTHHGFERFLRRHVGEKTGLRRTVSFYTGVVAYIVHGESLNIEWERKKSEVLAAVIVKFNKFEAQGAFIGRQLDAMSEGHCHFEILHDIWTVVQEYRKMACDYTIPSTFALSMTKIEHAYVKACQAKKLKTTQAEPIGAFFGGKPGTGKSFIVSQLLPQLLLKKCGLPCSEQAIYNIPCGDENRFWDNYHQQPYIYVDEFLQDREGKDALLCIKVISTGKYFVNMADLTAKGMLFESEFFVASSNALSLNNVNNVTDKDAIARRFETCCVEVLVNSAYAINGGKLDYPKLTRKLKTAHDLTTALTILDTVWTFKEVDLRTPKKDARQLVFSQILNNIHQAYVIKKDNYTEMQQILNDITATGKQSFQNVDLLGDDVVEGGWFDKFLSYTGFAKKANSALGDGDEVFDPADDVDAEDTLNPNPTPDEDRIIYNRQRMISSFELILARMTHDIGVDYTAARYYDNLFGDVINQHETSLRIKLLHDYKDSGCTTPYASAYGMTDCPVMASMDLNYQKIIQYNKRGFFGRKFYGFVGYCYYFTNRLPTWLLEAFTFGAGLVAATAISTACVTAMICFLEWLYRVDEIVEEGYSSNGNMKAAKPAPKIINTVTQSDDEVQTRVRSNMRQIVAYGDDCKVTKYIVQTIFVDDRRVIIPDHFFEMVQQYRANGFCAVYFLEPTVNGSYEHVPVNLAAGHSVLIDSGEGLHSDARLFYLHGRAYPKMKKIDHFFMREGETQCYRTKRHECTLLGNGYMEGHDYDIDATIGSFATFDSEATKGEMLIVAETKIATRGGDCGRPYILGTSQMHPIVGIHMVHKKRTNITGVVRITYESLQEARSELDELIEEPAPVVFTKSEVENGITSEELDCKFWNKDVESLGCAFFQGKRLIHHSPPTTKFVPLYHRGRRTFHEEWDCDFIPAAQTTVYFEDEEGERCVHPLYSNCFKYQQRAIVEVKYPTHKYIADFYKRKIPSPELSGLTFHDAINGNGEMQPLAFNTGAGYWSMFGFNEGKKTFFKELIQEEGDRLDRTFSDKARNHVIPEFGLTFVDFLKESEQKILRGETYVHFWVTTTKDELRSAKKVKVGKTRIFEQPGLDFVLLCRKYFGEFLSWYKSNAGFTLYHGIGKDKEEVWGEYHRKFSEVGNLAHAFDYSDWDGSIVSTAFDFFLRATDKFYHKSPEAHRTARHTLISMLINGLHIAGGFCFRTHQGNKSGNPFTDVLNSVCNTYIIMYAFVICQRVAGHPMDLAVFDESVRMLTYGDDVAMTVRPDVLTWFKGPIIKEVLDQVGFTITDALKSGVMPDHIDINQMTFLKSHFVVNRDYSVVLAPMPITDIYKELKYAPKNVIGDLDDLRQRVAVTQRFMAHHGPKQLSVFQRQLTDVGIPTAWISLSYQQFLQELAEKQAHAVLS